MVQLNNVPLGTVSNLDKLVHAFFHFVLTFFCFLFLKSHAKDPNSLKPLIASFIFSVFFGIGIEIAQELFTTTRHAEVFDVLANLSGATLTVVVVILFGLNAKLR